MSSVFTELIFNFNDFRSPHNNILSNQDTSIDNAKVCPIAILILLFSQTKLAKYTVDNIFAGAVAGNFAKLEVGLSKVEQNAFRRLTI